MDLYYCQFGSWFYSPVTTTLNWKNLLFNISVSTQITHYLFLAIYRQYLSSNHTSKTSKYLEIFSYNVLSQKSIQRSNGDFDSFFSFFFTQFQKLKILQWLKEVFQGEPQVRDMEVNPIDWSKYEPCKEMINFYIRKIESTRCAGTY